MQSLRVEADEAITQVEDLKAKVKTLEHENMTKDQEITSLQHKNQLLESGTEKLEGQVKEHKDIASQSAQHGTENESLQRKLTLLEEEAEENDKKLRDAHQKLRDLDVKAGHYERKTEALQVTADQWEKKYEEMAAKQAATEKELQDFQAEMANI
ncbi:MAG: hypothetical protein M1814_003928 [Vezdaea aestivalis]|nr:MAG: hypothetical protein M1814_003928 [Vezdaea aestivalis]